MATPQPLVCASLHLPPDPQPFLRIHEISLLIFLPNIERLRLDLEETQDINPEATAIFSETRQVVTNELHRVFKVLHLAQMVAERYHKVLNALEEKIPTQDALYEVHLSAAAATRYSAEGQKALSVFRRELERAVERVTATAGGNRKGRGPSLSSPENIRSVSEVFTAIDECNELLQQCHDQFVELDKQTRNKNSIDSDPPSEEETRMMRAKWQTFFDAVKGVWKQGLEVATEISMPLSRGPQHPSRSRKSRQNIPLWRTLFRRQDKQDSVSSAHIQEVPSGVAEIGQAVFTPGGSHEMRTNAITPVGATNALEVPDDTAIQNAAPLNSRTGNNLQVPFWRKIFQRTNCSSPPDVSERLQVADDAPKVLVPPLKIPLWRKFYRRVTCVSATPFR